MSLDMDFDFEEAIKKIDKFSQEDFNKFKESTRNIDKSKCVPKDLTDKQLLLFYNACYGDIEKAKICIEKYYLHRKNLPELFSDRNLDSEEMKQVSEVVEYFLLPEKSVEGYDIIFHRFHIADPSQYNYECACKLLCMCVDTYLAQRGPQPGYLFVYDMRGCRMGHVRRLRLSILRKICSYVQEAMPVRVRGIHVLNTEPLVDKIMPIIRPFMDRNIYNMFKFHNKNESLESFYETVISKSALPSDYGGTLPDTQTLHKEYLQQIRSMHSFFEAEEEQRATAVPNKKRDERTDRNIVFSKLNID